MPTEPECDRRRTECRGSVYSAINRVDEKVDEVDRAKVGKWAFGIILTIAMLAMAGVLSYLAVRGNGKATTEDLAGVRARADAAVEETKALKARQEMILRGQDELRASQDAMRREMGEDLKKILDRLPPK